jgi:hypothetical protein
MGLFWPEKSNTHVYGEVLLSFHDPSLADRMVPAKLHENQVARYRMAVYPSSPHYTYLKSGRLGTWRSSGRKLRTRLLRRDPRVRQISPK